MEAKKWFDQDWSEEFCIFCLALVAIFAILYLGTDASNVVSAVGGGLVGYLKRGTEN